MLDFGEVFVNNKYTDCVSNMNAQTKIKQNHPVLKQDIAGFRLCLGNEILSSPVLSTKLSNWLKPLKHEFPPTIIYPPGN